MTPIAGIARQFFDACEAGKGWDGCKAYCHPNADVRRAGRAAGGHQDPSAVHRTG